MILKIAIRDAYIMIKIHNLIGFTPFIVNNQI